MLEYADTLSSNMITRSDVTMTVGAEQIRVATDVQLEHLERLGEELERRGMQVRAVLPAGRVPSLYVVNPEARALEEHIYAGCGTDGGWGLWRSWAGRISPTEDRAAAAIAIPRAQARRAP